MTYIDVTPKEIVDGFVSPHGLTEAEKLAADKELLQHRLEIQKEKTEEERLKFALQRLRFLIEDYIKAGVYVESFSFQTVMSMYVKTISKKQIEIAKELALHPSKLSQILNGSSAPNIAFLYRIEAHSSEIIQAALLWSVFALEKKMEIQKDDGKRAEEAKKVRPA